MSSDRRMATPRHLSHYRKSHERDRLTAIVTISWLTGVLLGVTLTLGWIDMTGGP